MSDLDRYLEELASRLHVGGRERARIVVEVRDHLEDSVAHNEEIGASHAAAIARAFDSFGTPAAIAANFNAAAGTRAMRRAPLIALSAGLAVFGGFLVAGTTQTHSTTPANATVSTQVSFFLAVLSFQIAVVAGICAGSRALALWRAPVARGADRQFVRRGSLVSICALGMAAIAWAVTMGLAFGRLTDPNLFTFLLGGSIMLIAAGLGVAAAARMQVNPSDEVTDGHFPEDEPISNGVLGFGEQCIGFVRRHPVVACGTLAALSIYPAMSHAETTVSGALPWGLAQAATVVLGFAILGRTLGLRPAETRDLAT